MVSLPDAKDDCLRHWCNAGQGTHNFFLLSVQKTLLLQLEVLQLSTTLKAVPTPRRLTDCRQVAEEEGLSWNSSRHSNPSQVESPVDSFDDDLDILTVQAHIQMQLHASFICDITPRTCYMYMCHRRHCCAAQRSYSGVCAEAMSMKVALSASRQCDTCRLHALDMAKCASITSSLNIALTSQGAGCSYQLHVIATDHVACTSYPSASRGLEWS